jgi:hypothetical protein
LIVEAVACLLLAFFAPRVRDSRLQRRVAESVEAEEGGCILYDWQPEKNFYKGRRLNLLDDSAAQEGPLKPMFVGNLLGDEYFQDIEAITCPRLSSGHVLSELGGLRGLHALYLPGIKVSANDFQALSSNTLTLLDIGRSRVLTDDHLIDLSVRLPQLTVLWIDKTRITNAGLEHIGRCPHLRVLNLSYTKTTGDGLRHLTGCRHLRYLGLERIQLDDDNVKCLASFEELEDIGLLGAKTGDQLFEVLRQLPQLRYVEVGKSRVTSAAVQQFMRARPDVEVD